MRPLFNLTARLIREIANTFNPTNYSTTTFITFFIPLIIGHFDFKPVPIMKYKFIILTALFFASSSNLFAQKKEYTIRSLDMIYNAARLQRETGLSIGEDRVDTYPCTTKIIIDEGAQKITGNISFYCSKCAVVNYIKSINLDVNKVAEGRYLVTNSNDKFNKCSNCAIIVNAEAKEITFDFLYFHLLEQATVFHVKPDYVNINAAIAAFDYEAVGAFAEKGVDLNAPYAFNGKNETPLNFLCDLNPWKSEKEEEMGKILLDKGVNVNIPDDQGFTPLMKTLQNVNVILFGMILQHNPDKNAKAKDGTTALKLAKGLVKKAENYTTEKYTFESIAKSLKN